MRFGYSTSYLLLALLFNLYIIVCVYYKADSDFILSIVKVDYSQRRTHYCICYALFFLIISSLASSNSFVICSARFFIRVSRIS